MQGLAAALVPALELCELAVELHTAGKGPVDGVLARALPARRRTVALGARVVLEDLVVDELVCGAQVVQRRGDLAGDAPHERELAREHTRRGPRGLEVEDFGDATLSVAVDAADALLEA